MAPNCSEDLQWNQPEPGALAHCRTISAGAVSRCGLATVNPAKCFGLFM